MTTPGDFVMKANDTLPAIESQLGFADGSNADLAGATIRFVLRRRPVNGVAALTFKVSAPAEVVNADLGRVRYQWAPGDTDTPGLYSAEWEVTYADGHKRTFPGAGYHLVNIVADLNGV